MKPGSVLAFLMSAFFISSVIAQTGDGEVIAYWSLNENQVSFPIQSDIGSSQLTTNFSSLLIAAGTSENLVQGYSASNALEVNVVSGESDHYLAFTLSTKDFTGIEVSYDVNKSTTGGYVGTSVTYSTDGLSYVVDNSNLYKSITSSNYRTKTFDFLENTEVYDQDIVYFRIALSGSNTIGSNAIDNIQITGTPIEETLPCELHSFAAIPGYQNSVNLSWITHSETGLLGFKLYRNNANDLNSAVQISSLISASNSSVTQTYSFSDTELDQEGTYYYWLETIEGSGLCSYTQPVTILWDPGQQPESPIFYDDKALQAYPNPFNPDTTIHYELSRASSVTLEVFNSRGQKIRSLEQASRPAGSYSVIWDGRTDAGQSCASGIYRLVLLRDKKRSERRVVLLK